MNESDLLWWKRGVIYQIYPRSFQDSDGDGVGDLRGIRNRLGYLSDLGVDAIWLSPIYPSPMRDFGYDVSDYTGIHSLFGTMEDFDALLADAHRRGLKVILDFVPNHSSNEHPWFVESHASRSSPKRDWYIWRDPAPGGGPPNNWLSNFGGPAWTFDESTRQYYYHAFLPEQPDLNWRNPEVQAAMFAALRFWLERGVDGFRVDVIWHIAKDSQFRDDPVNPEYLPSQAPNRRVLATYSSDQPDVHDIIARMRHVLDAYPERMMVGEVYLPIDRLVAYYGAEGGGVHLPFNFHLISVPWNARALSTVIRDYEASLPRHGWPNWVLGNHDNPRLASRIGEERARQAAMLLLTLRGTPTLYYGDEIGMRNVPIPPDRVRDPFEKNVPGMGHGRDPERTPLPWDGSPKGGFTTGDPWLPMGDEPRPNVHAQIRDPKSILNLYRALIRLRRAEPSLAIGSFEEIRSLESRIPCSEDVLAYRRQIAGHDAFLILINFAPDPCAFTPAPGAWRGILELSTHAERLPGEEVGGTVNLGALEGLVIRLRS